MTAHTPSEPRPRLTTWITSAALHIALVALVALTTLTFGCAQDAQDASTNTTARGDDAPADTLDDAITETDDVNDVDGNCLGCFPSLGDIRLASSSFCGGWATMSAGGYAHSSLSAAALVSAGQSMSADGAYLLRSGPAQLLSGVIDQGPSTCGDGVKGGAERCDGADTGGLVCENLGFAGGVLGCMPDCQALDADRCLTDADLCTNGQLSPSRGWECAKSSSSTVACADLGFDSQSATATASTCSDLCQWDAQTCIFDPLRGVTAGAQHVCALSGSTVASQVTCWGADLAGQSSPYDATDQRHPSLSEVHPGGQFTCGVRTDNLLTYCWGDEVPTCALPDCDPIEPLTAIHTSQDAYCGINAGGEVRCAVTPSGAPIPLSSPLISLPQFVTHLDLSADYLCLMSRQASVEVYCLRRADTPPLRQGSVTLTSIMSSGPSYFASGDNSACVLDAGTIRCARITTGPTSLQVLELAATDLNYFFTTLDVSGDTACGYSDNAEAGVYCWDALADPVGANAPAPLDGLNLGGVSGVFKLTMGADFVCLDTDLGARCAARLIPGAQARSVGGLTPDTKVLATSLALTSEAGCALVYDPQVDISARNVQPVCWGDVAGAPTLSAGPWRALHVLSAQDVCLVDDAGEVLCAMQGGEVPWRRADLGLTQVTLSLGMGCGLTAQGEARCWDVNGVDILSGPNIPPSDARFAKLSLSPSGSWCGVLAGGEVEGVGPLRCSADLVTRYGIGTPDGSSYVSDLSLTDDYLCTVTPSGWLGCWGAGKPSEAPPNVSDGSPFKRVVTAPGFACGLRFDGEVACWGEVPRGVAASDRRDVAVDGLAAGSLGVCAHRRNDEVACWGAVGLGHR
jgi:hypothetical protein